MSQKYMCTCGICFGSTSLTFLMFTSRMGRVATWGVYAYASLLQANAFCATLYQVINFTLQSIPMLKLLPISAELITRWQLATFCCVKWHYSARSGTATMHRMMPFTILLPSICLHTKIKPSEESKEGLHQLLLS